MTTNNLTEQWKKGELEDSEYYIKSNKGDTYIDICANGSFMFTNCRSIEKVLAPVPSYKEWKLAYEQLNKNGIWYTERSYKELLKEKRFLEVSVGNRDNTIQELREENQQLKECLKNCRELFDTWDYPNIVKEIDEALK